MKKIDLHIHTKKTISDSDFSFSLERLKQYVHIMQIDAIAITNHNTFDRVQYEEIKDCLTDIEVFPGVELNIGNNGGHLLIITEASDADDFFIKCQKVERRILSITDSLSLDEFHEIFTDLRKYLLIPHYIKDPHVDKNIITILSDYITCGEVSSPKKFQYSKKQNRLTPVLFSDWRPVKEGVFPVKQTYIDVGDISIKALKKSFIDKDKVHLSDEEGHHLFQVLPNLFLSTGLSVIIGERSSGKSYTLNQIFANHENVKYIKQFSLLLEKDTERETSITKDIESKYSQLIQDYLRPFSLAVSDVLNVDIEKDEKSIAEYIESLIKYASEREKSDAFSKCKLFSETGYTLEDFKVLEELISAIEKILDARKYREIIEKHIERGKLVALHKELIRKCIEEKVKTNKKEWVNELLGNIKLGLQSKSAAPRIQDVNFYDVQMNREKVYKFNQLVREVESEKIIREINIEGFTIRISKRKYEGAGELKKQSGKNFAFRGAYEKYGLDKYVYLKSLKEISGIQEKDYYQYFAKIEYKILNQFGYEVSGGERAEFNLLQEINDALQYDMLLIDEPESSFDNIFLREKVNHLIKDISNEMPVVLVTHNNTVGVSIKPDFIVYAKRLIESGKAKFVLYTGFPGDRELKGTDGTTIPNIKAILDCLEAGRDAYEERRKDYEILED